MTETNWDRYSDGTNSMYPTSPSDIVIRLQGGYFNFDVVSSSDLNHFRSVIVTQ